MTVSPRTRIALLRAHEEALVLAERLGTKGAKALQRADRKHKTKKKVWVEITHQPKKSRHGKWVGQASFIWKGDATKHHHSQVITLGGQARLTIRSSRLHVRPKKGDEYDYGVVHEGDSKEDAAKQKQEHEAEHGEAKLDPSADSNGDGVADAARVGVPAAQVPPPPPVPRLPNLDKKRAAIEQSFCEVFEHDPDKLADDYYSVAMKKSNGGPPEFVTDDVKYLHPDYRGDQGPPPSPATMEFRARNNVCLHQAANAIAKRAFLKHLDTLAKLNDGDPLKSVLVTSGGCGSGKGFCLKKGPEAVRTLKGQAGAVWDAAGEQNATENPWIMDECKKRGIKPTFMFCDAPPERQWAHPKMGVVQRASDPNGEGRMVDARLFADSYALGAKNFKAFHEKHQGDAKFVFINTWDEKDGNPDIKLANDVDDRSLKLDSDKLYQFATKTIQEKAPNEAIKDGATVGQKIWGPPGSGSKEHKTAASAARRTTPMRLTATDAKKDPALEKLKDTLQENMRESLKAIDEFERQEEKENMAATKDKVLVKDKNGKLSRRAGTVSEAAARPLIATDDMEADLALHDEPTTPEGAGPKDEDNGNTCPHCGGTMGPDGACTACGFSEEGGPEEVGADEPNPLAQEPDTDDAGLGLGADSTTADQQEGSCPTCGDTLDESGKCPNCSEEDSMHETYSSVDIRMDDAIASLTAKVKLPAKTALLLEQAATAVAAAYGPLPKLPKKLSASQESTLQNYYRLSIGGVPEGYKTWVAALDPRDKAKILEQMAKSEADTPELKTLKV